MNEPREQVLARAGMSLAELPEFTAHARARWEERCQGLDLAAEWASALRLRCGKKALRRIRECCPLHAEFASKSFRGFYYKMSLRGVVFVMKPPLTVVTVLRLDLNPPKPNPPTP